MEKAMKLLIRICAMVVLLFLFSMGTVLAEIYTRPILLCPMISPPPKIDGKITEDCWQKASHLTNYLISQGDKLALEQTEAWLGYDNSNLYLAFKCYDSQMNKIKAGITTRDANVWTDDCVEIFLDTDLTRRHYCQLIVNSLGTQQDINCTEFFEVDWNIEWEAKSFRAPDYWSVEIAIPFAQLGLPLPSVGQRWGINFNRELQRLREYSGWAPTGNYFYRPSRFGDLVFSDKPGIDFKINNLGEESKEVEFMVSSKSSNKLLVELNTVSLDGAKANCNREIDLKEFGQIIKIPYKFAPSWQEFVFNVTVKDVSDQKLLYQSPNFPLQGNFLEAKLSKAGEDSRRLFADNMIMKAELKKSSYAGYILTPKRAFEIVLPKNMPKDDEIGKPIHIFASPSEYESASFLIYTTGDLKNVKVSLSSDLREGKNKISKNNIDIRLLKRWYQSGRGERVGETVFVPELLLKNDELITSDHIKQRNILNFKGRPEDSSVLLPFDIPAYTNKQIWMIVKVPS
ncbi:MAG: carbohydrate binding family 9 domain-containing protein, partial [Candidatus Omnitrophota bacterium]